MKVVKKNVYYCEYCGKHGLRSIEKHEKHCTANPNRQCRMCEGRDLAELIEDFKAMVETDYHLDEFTGRTWETKKMSPLFSVQGLLASTDGCPACTLAVIRCAGLPPTFDWNYKAATEQWWISRNSERYYQ